MKLAVKITFLHLLLVAVTGLLMRAMPFIPAVGIEFDHLRHAHSHLAFLGWVFPAFLLAFVHWFLPPGSFETPRYRPLFWGSQVSAAGMFMTFLASGYSPFSIALLTAHTLLAWVFIAFFLKDLSCFVSLRLCVKQTSRKGAKAQRCASDWFAVAGLAAFFLSSLGPFAIPVIQIVGGGNPLWMKTAVGFYLHFQTSGWFVLATLALFLRALEKAGISYSGRLAKGLLATLALSLLPTFFANLPFEFSPAAKGVMQAAAAFQWFALLVFAFHVFQINRLAALASNRLQAVLLIIFLVSLCLKMTCQMLALLPGLENTLGPSNHFLTLGYLHLLFLGGVTALLFYFFSTENPAAWSGRLAGTGVCLYLLGFVGTEALLFLAGLGVVLPDLAVALLLFSGCLLVGIGVLTGRVFLKKAVNRHEALNDIDSAVRHEIPVAIRI